VRRTYIPKSDGVISAFSKAAKAECVLRQPVNWVLDLDIRTFFDTVDHGWLVGMLRHRIADPRVLP
jgi:retron-type reverse transcriptase